MTPMGNELVAFVLAVSASTSCAISIFSMDYTCNSDQNCRQGYICCTQISCNQQYDFVRMSSGCVKDEHCKTKITQLRPNGQFSARLPFFDWSPSFNRLKRSGRLNTCQAIHEQLSPGVINTTTRPTAPQANSCDSAMNRTCEKQGKFCCMRLECSSETDLTLQPVCVRFGGCALKKITKRVISRTNERTSSKLIWFPHDAWARRTCFEEDPDFAQEFQTKTVNTSCAEASTFYDWLRKADFSSCEKPSIADGSRNLVLVQNLLQSSVETFVPRD